MLFHRSKGRGTPETCPSLHYNGPSHLTSLLPGCFTHLPPKPSQHAFICSHKKHSELRQYAITTTVVSSVSLVSSTPWSPQLSAMTDPMNRYAPSHQVEASGVLVYGTFKANSFIFNPCSFFSNTSRLFMMQRYFPRNWCSDQMQQSCTSLLWVAITT